MQIKITIFRYRSGDSADGVDQSVAANSDAGARAARSRGATDRRRERHVAARHLVALSASQFATAAKPTALCKYLRIYSFHMNPDRMDLTECMCVNTECTANNDE